ncbi:MAG: hypothetical protein U1E73_04820 [Planctomycetota bacterium]
MKNLLLSLLLPATAAALTAQTAPNLVGVTLLAPSIWQGSHQTCTQLSVCTAPGLTSTLQFLWQGGSAWDSQTSTAWASDGTMIGRYDPASCSVSCAPQPCPRTPGSDVCGLDLFDSQNQLWIIDSAGVITRCTNNCALPVAGTHVLTPLVTHIPTGISIDELRGLVFYSAVDFSSGQGDGRIYFAPLSNPGAWFGWWNIVDCFSTGNHRITGLAVDAGNSAIFWTDGRNTYRATYTYTGTPSPGSVVITPGTCCMQIAPLGDPLMDLSIKWGGATSAGGPCANGTCPSCPNVHVLRNAPLLGTTLQLGLDQAPVGMPFWCLVNFGACSSTGTTFGPLCGPLLVALNASTLTLGFQVTAGSTGCTGTATQPLWLPPNPILAGITMSSQFVGLCPPTGTAMSNCLSWVMQ